MEGFANYRAAIQHPSSHIDLTARYGRNHCFGGGATGAPGKGEDQRTILPSLNLTV
jgi:hypothetical protein